MDWSALLNDLFHAVLIPALGVLTTFLVKFLTTKANQITERTNSDLIDTYIWQLKDIVQQCVIATNQTYVNAMKDKNAFDKDAQEAAFKLTYDNVMTILGTEAKEVLSMACGDVKVYVTQLIEQQVSASKSK